MLYDISLSTPSWSIASTWKTEVEVSSDEKIVVMYSVSENSGRKSFMSVRRTFTDMEEVRLGVPWSMARMDTERSSVGVAWVHTYRDTNS